jgi:shikimate dehydrogenase
MLNKDMTLCISLAGRPSNIGTRFHNYLYEELGLNFAYKAFTTRDIDGAIGGVRALGIRGCSVSMPFKESVIPLVEEMTASATAIDSVNTIVNDDGRLTAYNTDYEAVTTLIGRHALDPAAPVLLRGSGGMAKAVVAAFRNAGFCDLTVLARNPAAGRALADKYGYRWVQDDPAPADKIIVNVTPLGMNGPEADALAFPPSHVEAARAVFDVVASPAETPLIRAARAAGKPVITGAEVIALQAARQFELYTGVSITADQVERASAFSRESWQVSDRQPRVATLGRRPGALRALPGGGNMPQEWVEVNIVPAAPDLPERLLVDVIDGLVHDTFADRLGAWFFEWFQEPQEHHLRLRLLWWDLDGSDAAGDALFAHLDEAQAQGRLGRWWEGNDGRIGEIYEGEAGTYGDLWELSYRDWNSGCELVLAMVRKDPDNRLSEVRQREWNSRAHLHSNRMGWNYYVEALISLANARFYLAESGKSGPELAAFVAPIDERIEQLINEIVAGPADDR